MFVGLKRFQGTLRSVSSNSMEMIRPRDHFPCSGSRRGGFGKAFAEIFQKGEQVEQVIREAATKALEETGYALLLKDLRIANAPASQY